MLPVAAANVFHLVRALQTTSEAGVGKASEASLVRAVKKAAGQHGDAVVEALKSVSKEGRLDMSGQPFSSMDASSLNGLLRCKSFWKLAYLQARAGWHDGLNDLTLPDRLDKKTIKALIQHIGGGGANCLAMGTVAGQWYLAGIRKLQHVSVACSPGMRLNLIVPVGTTVSRRSSSAGGRVTVSHPGKQKQPTSNATESFQTARSAVEPSRPRGPSHLDECEKRLMGKARAHAEYFRFFCQERAKDAEFEAHFHVARLCEQYTKNPTVHLLELMCRDGHKAVVSPELRARLQKGGPEAAGAVAELAGKCAKGRMQFANMLADFEKEVALQKAAIGGFRQGVQPNPPTARRPVTLSGSPVAADASADGVSVVPPGSTMRHVERPTDTQFNEVRAALAALQPGLGDKLDLVRQCHRFLNESGAQSIELPEEYRKVRDGEDNPAAGVNMVRARLAVELARHLISGPKQIAGFQQVLEYYAEFRFEMPPAPRAITRPASSEADPMARAKDDWHYIRHVQHGKATFGAFLNGKVFDVRWQWDFELAQAVRAFEADPNENNLREVQKCASSAGLTVAARRITLDRGKHSPGLQELMSHCKDGHDRFAQLLQEFWSAPRTLVIPARGPAAAVNES